MAHVDTEKAHKTLRPENQRIAKMSLVFKDQTDRGSPDLQLHLERQICYDQIMLI